MTTTQPAAALPVLKAERAFIGTMQGDLVAECTTFGTNAFTAEARAKELVKRANAFPGLVEALERALEWIDAVPEETVLPTMPGFERDEVDCLLSSLKQS